MAEPYEEAEERESSWDRACELAPKCDCCGGSIYPYETYMEIDGNFYCEHCVDMHIHLTDNLEV